jgi:ABC transporter DrrB family efflux protein
MNQLISDTMVITKRNLIRVVRTPQLLFFNSVQPVMFVLLFRYVFGGAIPVPGFEGRYVDYLIPGILVQTSLFGGAGTAVGLAEDLSKGIVDRFRSLPMSRSAVLAGRALSDVVRNFFVLVLMLVVGTLVGFRFHNGFFPALLAVVLLLGFGFAFSWFFALIALLVKDPETAQVAGFLPVFPLTFAASTFVPIASMPGWLQAFARVQPVTQMVNATRSLTQGVIPPSTVPALKPVLYSLAYIVGITVVFAGLSIRRYRKG